MTRPSPGTTPRPASASPTPSTRTARRRFALPTPCATQLDTGTVGSAGLSGVAGGRVSLRDLNGNHFAQPNEVTITHVPLATGGGFNRTCSGDAPTAGVARV